MAFDLIADRDSLIATLIENIGATTTSINTLSYKLQSVIKDVRAGKPADGIENTETPLIFVNISDYNEELNTLGGYAFRNASWNFEVCPVIQEAFGSYDASITSEKEMIRATQNILDVLRNKTDLSITGLWVEKTNVIYDDPSDNTTTYVRCSKIEYECKKLIF